MRKFIQIIEAALGLDHYDNIDAFFDDLSLELAPRYPNIDVSIEDDNGQVYMASLAARHKGEGDGTRFMRDLCALLDLYGITMELEPSRDGTMDDTETRARLGRWYEGFGFFWIDDYRMRRNPRNVA